MPAIPLQISIAFFASEFLPYAEADIENYVYTINWNGIVILLL